MSGLGGRVGLLAAAAASNAVCLAAGLASLTAVVRLLDRPEFAAWMVALAAQALVSVIPNALGPGCARWLGQDPGAAGTCHRIRDQASWAAAALLTLAGLTWWGFDPTGASPLAWGLLALQLPALALETHRLQTLQMRRHFLSHAALLPLARLAKALALWTAVAAGGSGIELVAGLQLAAQVGVAAFLAGAGLPKPGVSRPEGFLRQWSGNLVSGMVVWGATRAAVVLLDRRADPETTASYGLADAVASSLQLPLQALATLVQPAVYTWNPDRGPGPLWRWTGLFALAGCGLGLAAVAGGPFLLALLAGPSGADSIAALRLLAPGVVAQACAVVPGTVLQRLGAGGTVAILETLAAAIVLGGLVGWPHLGAVEAAGLWSAGRVVWAVGSCLAAFHLVGRLRG